jgi:hypothetical protein
MVVAANMMASSGFTYQLLYEMKTGAGVKTSSPRSSDEACSTAAPSPAIAPTSFGPSPAVSPMEGYASSAWVLDQFALPEASTDHLALDAHQPFRLTGIEDLQKNLSCLLAGIPVSPKAAKAERGLAPPPGLALPPGLCAEDMSGFAAPAKESPLPPGCVTAMLRNIPNKYTQEMLIERLHEDGFKGDIDFIYLPIDFKNRCNFGYGFVNFRNAEACERFAVGYHLMESQAKLPGFRSRKVIEVSPARHQGLEENIARLQHSPVLAKLVSFGKQEWLPKLLSEHGEVIEVLHPTKTPATRRTEA